MENDLRQLEHAARICGAVVDFVLKDFGLNRHELSMLEWVDAGQRSPSALAAALMTTRASTTKRLDRLEAAGLVTRTVSASDRRSIDLGITPAATALMPQAIAARDEAEAELLGRIPAGQREQFFAALAHLISSHGAGR